MFSELKAEMIAVRSQRFIQVLAAIWIVAITTSTWTTLNQDTPLSFYFLHEVVISPWSQMGLPFACILGGMIMGQEYKHNSLASRVAGGVPRRNVLGAKLVTSAAFSLFFSILGVLPGIVLVALDGRPLENSPIPSLLALGVKGSIGLAGVALVACSITALVRSELISVVLIIGWFGLAERIVRSLISRLDLLEVRVLPGEVIIALSNASGAATLTEIGILTTGFFVIVIVGLVVFSRADIDTA